MIQREEEGPPLLCKIFPKSVSIPCVSQPAWTEILITYSNAKECKSEGLVLSPQQARRSYENTFSSRLPLVLKSFSRSAWYACYSVQGSTNLTHCLKQLPHQHGCCSARLGVGRWQMMHFQGRDSVQESPPPGASSYNHVCLHPR